MEIALIGAGLLCVVVALVAVCCVWVLWNSDDGDGYA